jgi:hypothetical protein
MESIIDFIKIIAPAALVLYGMFLTFSAFVRKEIEYKKLDIRDKKLTEFVMIRLQAYERMCIFMERISPENLILRVREPKHTVSQLQELLLAVIREEYGYNLSQQIYISDKAWVLIRSAMEDVLMVISAASQNVDANAPGIELAKAILEDIRNREVSPITPALELMKKEVRELLGEGIPSITEA